MMSDRSKSPDGGRIEPFSKPLKLVASIAYHILLSPGYGDGRGGRMNRYLDIIGLRRKELEHSAILTSALMENWEVE